MSGPASAGARAGGNQSQADARRGHRRSEHEPDPAEDDAAVEAKRRPKLGRPGSRLTGDHDPGRDQRAPTRRAPGGPEASAPP